MATITKFYFHGAASANTGTLPTAKVSATTPTVTTSGSWTQRVMDGTKGTSETSQGLNTSATKVAQTGLYWQALSAPIAAQTIAAQGFTISSALAQGNTNSALYLNRGCLAVWRPSTGALIGRIFDQAQLTAVAATTVEYALNGTVASGSTSAVTAADGDILVYECWTNCTQAKASAYFDSYYIDGTTEDGTVGSGGNAAYILFTNAVTMLGGAAAGDEEFPFSGGGYYPFEVLRRIEEKVRRRFWRPGWARRASGLVVPA
jgi:hypothetical protein